MGEVRQLFSATRFVADWESLGGILSIGQGPFGPNGELMPALLEIMPQSWQRSPDERERIAALKRQVSRSDARLAVVDFLARRASTRGW